MRISELQENKKIVTRNTAAKPQKNIPEKDRVAVRFCLTWLGLEATMKNYRNLDPAINWQELYNNLQNPCFEVVMKVPDGGEVVKEIRAADRQAAEVIARNDYPGYNFLKII